MIDYSNEFEEMFAQLGSTDVVGDIEEFLLGLEELVRGDEKKFAMEVQSR